MLGCQLSHVQIVQHLLMCVPDCHRVNNNNNNIVFNLYSALKSCRGYGLRHTALLSTLHVLNSGGGYEHHCRPPVQILEGSDLRLHCRSGDDDKPWTTCVS